MAMKVCLLKGLKVKPPGELGFLVEAFSFGGWRLLGRICSLT